MSWEENWRLDESGQAVHGGHATVRRVISKADGLLGALKVLKESAQQLPERRFRMQQEVNALRALTSGVPALYETNATAAEATEELYVVMEWIPGPTLGERVSAHVLTLDDALSCTLCVLETLAAMHALPVVHRDLKPDNLILRNSAVHDPVLIDLGLAWAASPEGTEDFKTGRGQELGNRFLRLPELAPGGSSRDPRSDVTLAAGLLLYMITGIAPRVLQDEQGRAPHERVLDRVPAAVKSNPRWARLARVFTRTFQTEVALRMGSAAELRSALMNLEPAAPVPDSVGPAVERARAVMESERWKRRQACQSALGALCAEFDGHLRELLGRSGLSLPGRHGFHDEGRIYENVIGLQVPGGGLKCTLLHHLRITETEVIADYGVTTAPPPHVYYRGSVADPIGLRESMWRMAGNMVALALDEFVKSETTG